MDTPLLTFVALALLGAATMAGAVLASRRAGPNIDEFLADIDPGGPAGTLAKPLLSRVVAQPAARLLNRFLPASYVDKVATLLAQAGLADKRSAAQEVAGRIAAAVGASALTAAVLLMHPPPTLGLTVLILPLLGFMVPSARLKRAVRTRSEIIFKDLPDIIDMLAIAVEAGSGFEAALSLVCEHFNSPMTDDLSLALNAMSLGMPRRQALQDLKNRTDLDVVRTFALAMIQADALGIPISRVLHSQADEIRARRRAWAREKAAKMPVKILFPLVLFIFPPILAVVLGPAAMQFGRS